MKIFTCFPFVYTRRRVTTSPARQRCFPHLFKLCYLNMIRLLLANSMEHNRNMYVSTSYTTSMWSKHNHSRCSLELQQDALWRPVWIPSHHISPPSCLPPHWQSSHSRNNPQAIIAINKKKPVYLVGTAVPMNTRFHGEWGENGERIKPWYSYKRMKSIWTKYISPFFSLSLFSFFDALGKNNGFCTFECTSSTPCLVDNYRLAWHWHYQYLGKLFPNYVRRDRELVLHLLCKDHRNVLSVVSEAFNGLKCANLLSHDTNLRTKGHYLAVVFVYLNCSCLYEHWHVWLGISVSGSCSNIILREQWWHLPLKYHFNLSWNES